MKGSVVILFISRSRIRIFHRKNPSPRDGVL